MERFTLSAGDNLMWTVKDHETGVSIDFREGLFNETQKVNLPDTLTKEQIEHLHTTMREFGDWMAINHEELCMCYVSARKNAIYLLSNEKYWMAMADAMNGLLIDWPDDVLAEHLLAEMEDYAKLSNGVGLTDAEKTNLLGAISLLEEDEANEVLNILLVFWHERYEVGDNDVSKWARDLLWWPAWCPATSDDDLNSDEDGED